MGALKIGQMNDSVVYVNDSCWPWIKRVKPPLCGILWMDWVAQKVTHFLRTSV